MSKKLSKQIIKNGHTYYINCSIPALPSSCIVLVLQCWTIWNILWTLCLLRVDVLTFWTHFVCKSQMAQMWTSGGHLVQGQSGRKLWSDIAKGKAINSEQGEEFRHQKHQHISTCFVPRSELLAVFCHSVPRCYRWLASVPRMTTWLNVTGHVTYILVVIS